MCKDSSANFKETTIAAVSTGLTPAGIAVIRLSGPEALSVADRAYVLETGNISMSGPAGELLENDAVRKAYLGS